METNQVVTGWRDQRGELAEELGRGEEQLGAPVGDRALEAVADSPVGKHGEASERKGWPGAVAAELLEAFAVVGVEVDACVEREAVDERGLPLAARLRVPAVTCATRIPGFRRGRCAADLLVFADVTRAYGRLRRNVIATWTPPTLA